MEFYISHIFFLLGSYIKFIYYILLNKFHFKENNYSCNNYNYNYLDILNNFKGIFYIVYLIDPHKNTLKGIL